LAVEVTKKALQRKKGVGRNRLTKNKIGEERGVGHRRQIKGAGKGRGGTETGTTFQVQRRKRGEREIGE